MSPTLTLASNYFSVIRLISIQTGTYLNALYSVVLATRGALAVTEDMVALAEAMPLEQNADLRTFFLQMLRIAEDARAKADSGCEALKNVQKDIERVACFTMCFARLALMVAARCRRQSGVRKTQSD